MGSPLQVFRVNRHVAWLGGCRVGVVVPSLAWQSTGSKWRLLTPKGMISVPKSACSKPESILPILLASRAILPSTSDAECDEVRRLFENARLSRTASFLAVGVQTADQLVTAIERIQSSTAIVVGCGGIGSLSAMLVAGAGVRNLILVDGDVVEESNLNRQLFWTLSDVGQPKVHVLKSAIQCRWRDMNVTVVESPVHSRKEMARIVRMSSRGSTRIVIHTGDKPLGVAVGVARLGATDVGVPFVSAGYQCDRVIVGPLVSGHVATRECRLWHTFGDGIMPSYGPQNAVAAGLLAHVAIANLAGIQWTTELNATYAFALSDFSIQRG